MDGGLIIQLSIAKQLIEYDPQIMRGTAQLDLVRVSSLLYHLLFYLFFFFFFFYQIINYSIWISLQQTQHPTHTNLISWTPMENGKWKNLFIVPIRFFQIKHHINYQGILENYFIYLFFFIMKNVMISWIWCLIYKILIKRKNIYMHFDMDLTKSLFNEKQQIKMA